MKRGRRVPKGQLAFGDDFDLIPGLPHSGPEVCGIDEAGRGPLAGPVVAACVILPWDFPEAILADSKTLSALQREQAFDLIVSGSIAWSLGFSSHTEIDSLGILAATFLAMRRAWHCLGTDARLSVKHVYVDGPNLPDLADDRPRFIPVVRGDALLDPVSAAGILAKVTRDLVMDRFDMLYPEYGYAKHRGYPTEAHRDACRRLGPSPIQRRTFEGLSKLI